MNFRPGLKLWSTNTDLLPEAALLVQNGPFESIELMPVPGTAVGHFEQYDIPFILHCATERFGVKLSEACCFGKKFNTFFQLRNNVICFIFFIKLNLSIGTFHDSHRTAS